MGNRYTPQGSSISFIDVADLPALAWMLGILLVLCFILWRRK